MGREGLSSGFYLSASALESAFFIEQDKILVERRKQMKEMAETKASLSEVSGITNDAILTHLVELGVRPETIAALATVPLIEVAWADGTIDAAERVAVLNHANARGVKPGSVEHELLERWLSHRPEKALFTAWKDYVKTLCQQMSAEELTLLREELLHATRATAKAAGGFLGIGSISREEQAVLDELAESIRP